MATILDAVLARGSTADRIVVLTTPDYTLIPPQARRSCDDPGVAEPVIGQFNAILREVAAESRGIAVVDISPISDRVPRDPTLVRRRWAASLRQAVRRLGRPGRAVVRQLCRGTPTASAAHRPAAAGVRRRPPMTLSPRCHHEPHGRCHAQADHRGQEGATMAVLRSPSVDTGRSAERWTCHGSGPVSPSAMGRSGAAGAAQRRDLRRELAQWSAERQ